MQIRGAFGRSKIDRAMKIRPFRNADVPDLVELWIETWAAFGPPPEVTAAKLEQAILARTFFDPATLWLAESSRGAAGWCHLAIDPVRSDTAVICALCLSSQAGSAGQDLLGVALDHVARLPVERTEVGVIRDRQFGYAGLTPTGHGIGIPQAADALAAVISDAGFSPARSTNRMVVSTANYRPPVSREALQLRRSTALIRETLVPADMRQASAMAHLDVESHRLVNRDGEPIAELDLWCSDPEAEVMNPHHAILDVRQHEGERVLEPAESFLIASLLQMLASRHIFHVETAVDQDQAQLLDQLRSLRFGAEQQGTLWEKR